MSVEEIPGAGPRVPVKSWLEAISELEPPKNESGRVRGGPTEQVQRKEASEMIRQAPDVVKPVADVRAAKAFLDALAPEESITFQTFDDRGKRPELARILHGDLDEHWAELLRLNRQGAGVYWTVNRTDLKGRTAAHVVAVRALFVDLDGAPIEPVRGALCTPSVIVESSPGRWHAYWKTEDVALAQFAALQRSLATRFGGDAKVHDLPRVMRLPGFLHCKAAPFVSRMVSL